MMELARRLRRQRVRPLIDDEARFYDRPRSDAEILSWQLEQLNLLWGEIRSQVPFYERLTRELRLPRRFESWEEFSARLPILDRAALQSQGDALRHPAPPPELWRGTGGSTAEPVRLPVWRSEIDGAGGDAWYARRWFGVDPGDRLFLIWGHAHLLGEGLAARINGGTRRMKDRLLGYHRHSAYDVSEEGLRRAARTLLAFRPAYVLAYSVALDRFARVNADLAPDFHRLGLKVAVATAESFPTQGGAALAARVLGCPVAMEYGAMETGVIAHQAPEGEYRVFWRHHAVETLPPIDGEGGREVLITSLYRRCLPLLRYRLGDRIDAGAAGAGPHLRFRAVLGRCNDCVELADGAVVHSEAFSHVMRDVDAVRSFQIVQGGDRSVRMEYISPRPLSPAEADAVRRRLARVHPGLETAVLTRTERIEQTVAGKTRLVRREVR